MENPFSRWSAAEALNFQITFFVVWMCSFVPMWLVMFVGSFAGAEPPAWLFVLFPLMFVLWFVGMGVSVYGAVQAGRGVWWRCPVAIPFVREHRRARRATATIG